MATFSAEQQLQTLVETHFVELLPIDLEEAIGYNCSRFEFGGQMEGFIKLDLLMQLANVDPTLERACM